VSIHLCRGQQLSNPPGEDSSRGQQLSNPPGEDSSRGQLLANPPGQDSSRGQQLANPPGEDSSRGQLPAASSGEGIHIEICYWPPTLERLYLEVSNCPTIWVTILVDHCPPCDGYFYSGFSALSISRRIYEYYLHTPCGSKVLNFSRLIGRCPFLEVSDIY
jgi:hypothetical protein